jgi:cytochrome c oxidase subunit 1
MFIAGMLYFVVFFGTLLRKKTEVAMLDLPESEAYLDEKRVPFLDRFKPWLVIMAVVLLLAYVPALYGVYKNAAPKAPPYQINNPIPDTLTFAKKR